ncbi:MAG: hypothetical protein K0R50_1847 [Eubacterium sp.]|nr:hypothetical protein [Eubacterium sp.]
MKNNILSISEYRNNPEFYFTKGLKLANKKNLGEAYRNLTKALELEPDNSEYKFNMACFLSELQRPGSANRMFNDILLNFEPTMFECFFGLGCNSFELGDNEKAAEHFDKYLYFDPDGEFSYEISEMAFYLKLYNEVSHENKFLKSSAVNLKKAQKNLKENNTHNAVNYLYKSIISNPLNIEARNLLTLALLKEQHCIRASYINSSVKNIDSENIFCNCLEIYILHNAKKLSKARRVLEILPYRPVKSREDLLCAATTLLYFNKHEELVKFIEMYIVDYSDPLIYSILLLSYVLMDDYQKAKEISGIITTCTPGNTGLVEWVNYAGKSANLIDIKADFKEQYKKLFILNDEPLNYRYDPGIYAGLLEENQVRKGKLPKKYTPIIEGALKKREIMYSSMYQKEIIGMLLECTEKSLEPFEAINGSYAMYSAALEYLYCKQFFIPMNKEELINKYEINRNLFNTALNRLSSKL